MAQHTLPSFVSIEFTYVFGKLGKTQSHDQSSLLVIRSLWRLVSFSRHLAGSIFSALAACWLAPFSRQWLARLVVARYMHVHQPCRWGIKKIEAVALLSQEWHLGWAWYSILAMGAKRKMKGKQQPEEDTEPQQQQQEGSVKVKQEALCVNGMQGKELSIAFAYALKKAGSEALEVYAQQFKQAKACKTADKVEFMKQILNKDFNPRDYKKAKKITVDDSHGQTAAWISWKKLCDEEGPAVAKVKIASGTIQKRAHEDLNPEAPGYADLEEDERYQYRHTVDVSALMTSDTITTKAKESTAASSQQSVKSNEDDEDDPVPPENQNKRRYAQIVATVKKQLVRFMTTMQEDKLKLAMLEQNQYIFFFTRVCR